MVAIFITDSLLLCHYLTTPQKFKGKQYHSRKLGHQLYTKRRKVCCSVFDQKQKIRQVLLLTKMKGHQM